MSELTQEYLKELLHYNPETGILTWKHRQDKWFKNTCYSGRWNKKYAGKEAGCIMVSKDGKSYKIFSIFKTLYRAHRIAWMYVTGEMPSDQIDHVDGNGLNNKFNNLRDVSNQINGQNTRKNTRNTSGTTGVSWNRHKMKWDAYISVNSRKVNLGRFINKNEAIEARTKASILYGFHNNHGSVRPL